MTLKEEARALIRAIERDRDRRDGADPGPATVAGRVNLWAGAARVETMIRRARRLHVLYERACSDARADADALGAAIVRAEARIVADARHIAPGCDVEFCQDPRGAPVRIVFPGRVDQGVGVTWEHAIGLR